jgi:hypothetical protein
MRSLALVVVAVLVTACSRPSTTPTPRPSAAAAVPTVIPTSTPWPTPTPAPTIGPLPTDLDPEIRADIEMRRTFRLPFDLDHVLAVARDPDAYDLIGFPMTKEEGEQLGRDQAEQERIIREVLQHPVTPGEYGGVYIDRDEMPGVVVALFTRDVEAHEAAIRAELGETWLFATRQVKYSKRELDAIKERITEDMGAAWALEIPADITGVGTHISENVVRIVVSSSVPDVAEIIGARYGLGDRIRVESDGTGVTLIPWGSVSGMVTLPGGKRYKAPPSTPVMLSSGAPGDSLGTCNGSDMGYGVGLDGRFEYPCQVGRRTILIQVPTDEDGEWRTIGHGTVVVKEGKTARLEIELDERP